MSINNPFNFGPRIGSIDNSDKKPEISPYVITIRRWRWRNKYGIGKSNPLAEARKEYYDEYIDVGEPDYGGGFGTTEGSGGGSGGGGRSGSSSNRGTQTPGTSYDGKPCSQYKVGNGPSFVLCSSANSSAIRCCSSSQAVDVVKAYKLIITEQRSIECLANFPGLLDCIQNTWESGKLTLCCNIKSQSSSKKLAIHLSNDLWTNPQYQPYMMEILRSTLLHEFVHVCGGTELDAIAIERLCGRVATNVINLSYEQFDHLYDRSANPFEFRTSRVLIIDPITGALIEVYRGKWVEWDPKSGFVYYIDNSGNRRSNIPLFPTPWIYR